MGSRGVAFGVETLDLAELDVGVLGPGDGGASHPPVGAGQPGGQVRTGPWSRLLRTARLGNDLAVGGLPQPDQAGLFAEHNGVVPPPDHRLSAVWRGRDGYQVAG